MAKPSPSLQFEMNTIPCRMSMYHVPVIKKKVGKETVKICG